MKTTIIICLVLFLSGFGLYSLNSDYFEVKTTKVTVLDKLESVIHSKRSATNKFILVLQLDDGRLTDMNVRPYVWSQAVVGDTLYFEMSEDDLQRDGKKNLIKFSGFMLMVLTSGLFIISRFIS